MKRAWLALLAACGGPAAPPASPPVEVVVPPAPPPPPRAAPCNMHHVTAAQLAASLDGATLATGAGTSDEDDPDLHAIDLWDLPSGTLRATLDAGSSFLAHIQFSPNGRLLVSVTDHHTGEGEVRLWDVATSALVAKQDTFCFGGVVFSPDSSWVAATGCHMALGVVHADGRTWRREYDVKAGDGAAAQLVPIAASADGKQLFYFVQDGRFEAYDVTGREPKRVRTAKTVRWAAFDVDVAHDRAAFVPNRDVDKSLADGVDVHVASTGARTSTLRGAGEGQPIDVSLTAAGDVVATFGSGAVVLFERSGSMRRLRGKSADALAAPRLTPDRRTMLLHEDRTTCASWDLAPPKRIRTYRGDVCASVFSPDATRVLYGNGSGDLVVFDLRTGDRNPIESREDAAFAWLKDAGLLAIADGDVRIVHVRGGAEVRLVTYAGGGRRAGLVVSRDGAWSGDEAAAACAGLDASKRTPSLLAAFLGAR